MNRIENHNFFAPPEDAKAALFFLEGHYQLNWREGGVEKTKFLSPAQIGKVFTVKDVFDSGWLASLVLRFAEEKKTHKILSVLPAGRRKIYVTDPHTTRASETAVELEVPLPTLLLIGCGQRYFLWATLDKTITEKSKICAAPFPNLDQSGSICFGRNVAPECRLDRVESVWRLILESPFNNDRAENRCRTHAGDVRKLLFTLDGKKTFPKNALIKTEHTVAELWQRVR
jgi:hypothetical protein